MSGFAAILLSLPKTSSVGIRAVAENQRMIECDVWDPAVAADRRHQSLQVALAP